MNKTKIQIKTFGGSILFEYSKKDNTIKDTLIEAVKSGAYLTGAYLINAYLRGSNLRGSNLRGSNLRGADLRGADLRGSNLSGADLRGAYLRDAHLSGSNLSGSDLRGAYLRDADLSKIKHFFQIIPEKGSFIAWKKGKDNHLIKLEIPAGAKRHNVLSGRKCRAEFVKVLDIRNNKGHRVKECYNGTNGINTLYRIGEIVKPDSYDPDPLKECSHGIHFFLTKQEAKDWKS